MKLDPEKLARAAKKASTPARASAFRREGVRSTVEFRRIADLPRRPPEHASPEDCAALSAYLRTDNGTWTLKPVQAACLAELSARGGVVGSIIAGGGKTLITLLAGEIMDAERPLVLVPSGLVAKTRAEFAELLRHWRVRKVPHVFGYEMLGRDQSAGYLSSCSPGRGCDRCQSAYDLLVKGDEEKEIAPMRAADAEACVSWCVGLFPDLIAADEAQMLKNPKAAVTRRVRRYLEENPSTVFMPFSGTLTNASLSECAHLYDWALKAHSPLPRRYVDVQEWGLAIDVDVPAGTVRFSAGALAQLYDEDEARLAATDEIRAVRSAVKRRIVETPGVVATHETFKDSTLVVRLVPLDVDRPDIDAAIAKLEERWCTPDEHPISDAASMWRHTLELGAGFFYVWNPRPPKEWLDARRAWSQVCRHILAHNARELDSELQVINAVHRGEYDGETPTSNGLPVGGGAPVDEVLRAWENIKPSFDPNTEPRWLDDAVVEHVRSWIAAGPGIVWCGHVAVAERIADVLGLPYYGRKGLDERGRPIESARPADGAIVASISSSGKGRNLQAWHRGLIIPAALGGAMLEQLLARMHRPGQLAPEVTYDLLITCARARGTFEKAVHEARFIQDTTGQEQRILFAEILDGLTPDVLRKNPARWGD